MTVIEKSDSIENAICGLLEDQGLTQATIQSIAFGYEHKTRVESARPDWAGEIRYGVWESGSAYGVTYAYCGWVFVAWSAGFKLQIAAVEEVDEPRVDWTKLKPVYMGSSIDQPEKGVTALHSMFTLLYDSPDGVRSRSEFQANLVLR